MSDATTGGFDLVLELDQGFMTRQAALTLALDARGLGFGSDRDHEITGVAHFVPTLRYLWFEDEGSGVGSRFRHRDSDDAISIVLALGDSRIDVHTLPLKIGGQPTVIEVAEPLRRIPIHGMLEVTARVEVRTLDARLDRADPRVVPARSVGVDLAASPQIDLQLDRDAIASAPLIVVQRTAAVAKGYTAADGTWFPPGAAAGEACLDDTVTLLGRAITGQVAATLRGLTDWRVGVPGWLVLQLFPADRPLDPTFPTSVAVRAFGEALLVLVQTVDPPGRPTAIARTQRRNAEGMVLTLANGLLVGGVIRKALIDAMPGLTAAHFYPWMPCYLAQPADITPAPTPENPRPEPYRLTSLVAGVDEQELLRIDGGIAGSTYGGGVNYTAAFHLAIAISAEVVIRGGVPQLQIRPTVVRNTVTEPELTIAWWVYLVLGAATGGLAAIVLAIVDAAVGGPSVEKKVLEKLGKLAANLPSTHQSVPGGAKLTVTTTALNQPDAPRRMLPFAPDVPFWFRDHDLVLGITAEPLPTELVVSCQIPDARDADRRIDAVGGVLPDGTRWGLSIDDAVAIVRAGQIALLVGTPPNQSKLEVSTSSRGLPYLHTPADPTTPNLGDLPTCP